MGKGLVLLVCVQFGVLVWSHREHKVHNIVLYPDKHSWCNTTPIKQVVGHPGCEQVELENNVCVGTCFSYSIPRTEPTAPGQVAPYCDSCQPSHATWKHVTLKCNPEEVEGGSLSKKVEVIEDCTCSSYSAAQQPGPEPLDTEVPQLMNLVHSARFNHSPKYEINHDRLAMSLKVLSDGEDVSADHDAIKEIMSQIRGEDHHHRPEPIHHNHLDDLNHKEAEELGHRKVGGISKLDILSKLEPGDSRNQAGHRHHHHHIHGGAHHTKVTEDHVPTLDMAPHHLKPAIEGSEIAYEAYHNPPVKEHN